MTKTTIATVAALVIVGIGGYIYLQDPFNPDRSEIRELSAQFMEDVKFKDFRSSARYHHELEQERLDIGRAIEELFLVKPEMMRIIDYRIVDSEIDSTGTRGRTLVNSRVRLLNRRGEDEDIEEADLQLYWMLRHPECPLGTDCEGGVCVDDSGQAALMEPEEAGDVEEQPEADRSYACDDDLEHRWFMNLDSTLEQKDYR